jgi:hypothetical protein
MRHNFGLPEPDVANTVAGDVQGTVVQAHTVHGGLHTHHHPARSTVTLPHRIGVVPPRTRFFQNRSALQMLTSPSEYENDVAVTAAGVPQIRVLSGLGGVGKTQLAVNYAEQLWSANEIELLVWVTAGSVDAIVSGYARAAAALTGVDDSDPKHSAVRFLEWLARTPVRWLVVLDDLQSQADLSGLWPPITQSGLVVVTTRRADAALRGTGRQLIKVGEFAPPEAHTYLEALLAEQPGLADDESTLLTQDLGYLPLALAQAGAYMCDRDLTCARYRARLADRQRSLDSLFPDRDGLPDDHWATVAATWSLSIEQADRLAPAGVARPLLEIASVLDANGIPAEVFTAPPVLDLLSTRAGRPIDENDAWDGLGCLRRLSLITWEPRAASRAVQAHGLVQRATQDSLSVDSIVSVTFTAADALVQIWPEVERDTVLSQVLRANTDALDVAVGEHLWGSGYHPVLLRAGTSLGATGQFKEAMTYFGAHRDAAARHMAIDHPDVLTIGHNLARWRGEAGDAAGAVAVFQDVLVNRLRVLGSDHPDTLRTRHNLAWWLGEAGDAAAAVAAFEDVLAGRLRVLGPDHPCTLTTRNNLAFWRGGLATRQERWLRSTNYSAINFDSLLPIILMS